MLLCTKYYVDEKIKDDNMGRAHSTHGTDEKSIQNNWKTRKEETTWGT
jgi:hypothetical protein